jgi:glycosyltransferase involved in cell wall biosynthesis
LQGLSIAVWHEIRKTNAKLIHVVHDHALICPSTAMTKGVKVCEKVCMSCSVYSRLRHLLAARPDAVVGPSQIVLDRHHEFGWFNNVSKQVVIPNALPKNWPKAKPAHDIKSPIKFGFIGRLDESKGIDILLQALSYLSNYPLILYIAGSGDEMQIRKRWIINVELLHQVEFLGVVNAADFLSKIDVLITPSRAHETFCNVVMEAASLGRPSIVSNNGALPERVNQGQTGWIVDECTPLAFAKKMQHVMDNPNEIYEKGSNALKDIEKFNPKYQAASYEKLCVDLLSNNFDA